MKRVTKAPVTNQRRNWWEVQVDWIHRDWIEEMKPSPSELNPFELTGFTWIESIKQVKILLKLEECVRVDFIWIGSINELESSSSWLDSLGLDRSNESESWKILDQSKSTGFIWSQSRKRIRYFGRILKSAERSIRISKNPGQCQSAVYSDKRSFRVKENPLTCQRILTNANQSMRILKILDWTGFKEPEITSRIPQSISKNPTKS